MVKFRNDFMQIQNNLQQNKTNNDLFLKKP
jgi:hypothetical protein